MGLFRGAVFHHGGVPGKQPISVNGAFPLLDGPFSNLNGPVTLSALMGRFPSRRRSGEQPIKKRGIKGFLISRGNRQRGNRPQEVLSLDGPIRASGG